MLVLFLVIMTVNADLEVGSSVVANYFGYGYFYSGKITRLDPPKFYSITYDTNETQSRMSSQDVFEYRNLLSILQVEKMQLFEERAGVGSRKGRISCTKDDFMFLFWALHTLIF